MTEPPMNQPTVDDGKSGEATPDGDGRTTKRWRVAIPAVPLLGAEVTASLSLSGEARLLVMVLIPLSTFLAAVTGSAYALLEAKRVIVYDYRVRRQQNDTLIPPKVPTKRALRWKIWSSAFAEVGSTVATAVQLATSEIDAGAMTVTALVALIASITAFRVMSEPDVKWG